MDKGNKFPKPKEIPDSKSLEYIERRNHGLKILKKEKEERKQREIKARDLVNQGYGIEGFPALRQDAITLFLKALEYNPEEIQACYQLGLLYLRDKDYTKSKTYFELYLSKNPIDKRQISSAKQGIEICEQKLQDNK